MVSSFDMVGEAAFPFCLFTNWEHAHSSVSSANFGPGRLQPHLWIRIAYRPPMVQYQHGIRRSPKLTHLVSPYYIPREFLALRTLYLFMAWVGQALRAGHNIEILDCAGQSCGYQVNPMFLLPEYSLSATTPKSFRRDQKTYRV